MALRALVVSWVSAAPAGATTNKDKRPTTNAAKASRERL
jgi:hypothetical protein